MVTIHAKKHDNFSVEFKFGFEDSHTDGKNAPVFSLDDIADEKSLPLRSLKNSIGNLGCGMENSDDYEYHLKMFAAIFKSALRNVEHQFRSSKPIETLQAIASGMELSCRQILGKYRSLLNYIPKGSQFSKERNYYKLADEFMSHIVEVRVMRVLKKIDASKHSEQLEGQRDKLLKLIQDEVRYRKRKGYGMIGDDPEVPIDHLSPDGSIHTVKVQKIYYINIIFQLCQESESSYKHFRILMTRNGILKVEEI